MRTQGTLMSPAPVRIVEGLVSHPTDTESDPAAVMLPAITPRVDSGFGGGRCDVDRGRSPGKKMLMPIRTSETKDRVRWRPSLSCPRACGSSHPCCVPPPLSTCLGSRPHQCCGGRHQLVVVFAAPWARSTTFAPAVTVRSRDGVRRTLADAPPHWRSLRRRLRPRRSPRWAI